MGLGDGHWSTRDGLRELGRPIAIYIFDGGKPSLGNRRVRGCGMELFQGRYEEKMVLRIGDEFG